MNVKKFKFNTGESYSILMADNGIPMNYPNLFVTINHRNASDASNTCHTTFEHIKYLYEICAFLKIDIEDRSKRGDFLLKTEMESIVKWAKRTVLSFRKHVAHNKTNNVTEFSPKRNTLESARQKIVIKDESDIAPQTSYNRITTFANYIGWLEEYLFPSKTSHAEVLLKSLRPKKFSDNGDGNTGEYDEKIIDQLYSDKTATDNLKDKSKNTDTDTDTDTTGRYKSLKLDQMIRVLDIVRPDAYGNPWAKEDVRYRNQLIINTLEATACRRGELARIRIDDIKTSPKNGRKYLHIRKNNDLKDKRKNTPSAKTLARLVPIDTRLSEMIDNYIINHRSNVPGAEQIPYLFITHHNPVKKPNALSLSALNKICKQLSKAVRFRVHPHAFRHTWNDRFSEYADCKIAQGKLTPAKAESDRQKLMGWSEDSTMARRYSKRYDDKRAILTGLELQEKNSTEIERIVGAYDEDILM